jgi:general secretion pathway protein G
MKHRYENKRPTLVAGQRRLGFTLLEVLLVMVILLLLGALVVPQYMGVQQQAQIDAAQAQLDLFDSALGMYYVHNGVYPSTQQSLDALRVMPTSEPAPRKWNGPYIDEDAAAILDPWGQPYQYRYPSEHGRTKPDIWSSGPDMQSGSTDDIVNWPVVR